MPKGKSAAAAAAIIMLAALTGCAVKTAPAETEARETRAPAAASEPPSPVPEDGEEDREAFDGETLFIGDSLTYHLVTRYLEPEGLMGEASCMAAVNSGLPQFFADWWPFWGTKYNNYGVACDSEFDGLSYYTAVLQSAGRYDTVYFLMGSNGSEDVTVEAYMTVIDFLLENYPEATIYMQTPPDCRTGEIDSQRVVDTVKATVEEYERLGETRVRLLDTNSVWGADYCLSDGVHLLDEGLELWYGYICRETR